MVQKLAELEVNKSADYHDSVIKALENAGFVIVFYVETSTHKYYYIAAESEE